MLTMPTGEEPPKGFEGLFAERKRRESETPGSIRIDSVTVSQLAPIEIKEMEVMRNRALDYFLELTGEAPTREALENELGRCPDGKSVSDRLLFRAYSGNFLVGYAQVFCGWPADDEWTIEQLLLDPSFRLQGIGTQIISHIEGIAKNAQVSATSIIAIPTRKGADSFWKFIGYTTETKCVEAKLGQNDRKVYVLRKSF